MSDKVQNNSQKEVRNNVSVPLSPSERNIIALAADRAERKRAEFMRIAILKHANAVLSQQPMQAS